MHAIVFVVNQYKLQGQPQKRKVNTDKRRGWKKVEQETEQAEKEGQEEVPGRVGASPVQQKKKLYHKCQSSKVVKPRNKGARDQGSYLESSYVL